MYIVRNNHRCQTDMTIAMAPPTMTDPYLQFNSGKRERERERENAYSQKEKGVDQLSKVSVQTDCNELMIKVGCGGGGGGGGSIRVSYCECLT